MFGLNFQSAYVKTLPLDFVLHMEFNTILYGLDYRQYQNLIPFYKAKVYYCNSSRITFINKII